MADGKDRFIRAWPERARLPGLPVDSRLRRPRNPWGSTPNRTRGERDEIIRGMQVGSGGSFRLGADRGGLREEGSGSVERGGREDGRGGSPGNRGEARDH